MTERSPLEIYNSTLVPMVIEQTSKGERSFDIFFPSAEGENYFSDR